MSDPRSPKGTIADLERAQGRLLSLLENPAIELTSDAVEDASRVLGEAVAELCRELGDDPGQRRGFEEQLRTCANNHAVLGTRLERRRELLARELGRTRFARRVLETRVPGAGTGGSCDIAG